MIKDILADKELAEVSPGIYSCLSEEFRNSDYDSKAGLYDVIVGNRLYNRLIWGNWPSAYHIFCVECLKSKPDAIVLDAGCGSLVFTAKAYAEADSRLVVLLDRSLGMLIKGRERLQNLCGSVPENVCFLQADIFDLPFNTGSFDLVMSHGVLHMFDDKARLLNELERVRKPDGSLAFTSLAANNWLGRKMLETLKRSGEVGRVHSEATLAKELEALPTRYTLRSSGNMVYATSA